jgi:hypothetical protein
MTDEVTLSQAIYARTTPERMRRVTKEWSELAGEPVRIEVPHTFERRIYAFGSELACLRLFHIFHKAEGAIFNYSAAKDCWYFAKG